MLLLFLVLVTGNQAERNQHDFATRLFEAENLGKAALDLHLEQDVWEAKSLLEDPKVEVKVGQHRKTIFGESRELREAKRANSFRRVLIELRNAKLEKAELLPIRRSRFLQEESTNALLARAGKALDDALEGKPAPPHDSSDHPSEVNGLNGKIVLAKQRQIKSFHRCGRNFLSSLHGKRQCGQER